MKPNAKKEPAKQTTIHRFFQSKVTLNPQVEPVPHDRHVEQPREERLSPQRSHIQNPEFDEVAVPTDIAEVRAGPYHTAEPPSFVTSHPTGQGQGQGPNAPRPRPLWHIELNVFFLELAEVRHPQTGPEMAVEVWYVHHTRLPVCRAPRLIRLDNIQDLWYADLCNAWFDQIQRQQPLRVHIVKPTPPYQLRQQAVLHIILEQGMIPQRVAILFTAAFHGGTRTGILQQAESSPDQVCTDQMVHDHNLQPQCDFRPCHLFSGRFRFDHQTLERVPSGISVLLDVGDYRTTNPSSSSGNAADHNQVQPNPDDSSDDLSQRSEDTVVLMQRPRFKAFPTTKAASPIATSQGSAVDSPGPIAWFHVHRALPAHGENQHQPIQRMVVQARNLDDFHQMLQWQTTRANAECITQPSQGAKIETWFSDPTTLPRSDRSRQVILSTNPAQWPVDVLQRWSDFIQPGTPVYLYVVQPDPPGGLPDVVAHVIAVQNPPVDRFAAIVSVTELLDDPWHPSRFCALLPNPVSRNELFQLAGISPEQVVATPGIGAYHGSAAIPEGTSYPVRHGFAFEVITDTLESEPDVATLWQRPTCTDHQMPLNTINSKGCKHNLAAGPKHGPTESIDFLQESDEPLAVIQTSMRSIHHVAQIHATLKETSPAETQLPSTKDIDSVECSSHHIEDHTKDICTGSETVHDHGPDIHHRWQQLASLRPGAALQQMAPIITWFVDHDRFPQCFRPREVFIPAHPSAWRESAAGMDRCFAT